VKFIIAKAREVLPLFWGRDGWTSNSYWASRYETKEAADKAAKILGLEKEIGVRVEKRKE